MAPKSQRGAAAKKAKIAATSGADDQTVAPTTVGHGSANSPAATLVVELLDRIFAYVIGNYWEPIFAWLNSNEFPTSTREIGLPLVHVARVNKYWYSVALRQLYRTVVICNPVSMRLLARILKEQPGWAFTDYFQSFTIEFWYKRLPSQPSEKRLEAQIRKENSEATWEVLPYIKKLHHFGLSHSSLDPIPRGSEHPPIPEFMTGLKSLSLREEVWSHHLYSQWIYAAAPTLERFRAPSYGAGGIWEGCPPMVRLRSLCTHRSGGWRLGDVGPAFNRSAGAYGRLEDVSVSSATVDDNILRVSAMLRCIAPTIQRLHLGLSFAHAPRMQGPVYDALAEALPAASNLRTFSLSTFRAPLLNDRAALVRAIPAGVDTLILRQGHPIESNVVRSPDGRDVLSVYGDEAEAILARVERGELTALKRYAMAGSLYFSGSTHDYHAKEREVFARRQTQILQTAKKLGVRLVIVPNVKDQLVWDYY